MTDEPEPKPEKRHIVICCDGTGNEISENISNVLKLYRTLRKTENTTPHQRVFYDPGVGTLARPNPWKKLVQDANAVFGLATGYGLDDNVLNSYEFIVDNYEDGDAIYLFGFSRGSDAGVLGRQRPDRWGREGAGQSRGLRADLLQAVFQRHRGPRRRVDGLLDLKRFTDGGAADVTPPQGGPGGAICPHPVA